jgi:hypothetical protein
MGLIYSELDKTAPSGILPRKPNGGLYTGELAKGDWGCFPVVPDAYIYTTENLKSANPPPRAMNFIPGGFNRVGNSVQLFPNNKKYNDTLLIQCIVDENN